VELKLKLHNPASFNHHKDGSVRNFGQFQLNVLFNWKAVNLELGPLCSPQFKSGPPSSLEQALSHRLQELVLSSGLINLESLCIEERKASWAIYADLICLNYDGNIFDAALLGLVAGLKCMRLPQATWDEDRAIAVADPKFLHPLEMNILLCPATFAISPEGVILADPDATEEEVFKETLTVVFDDSGNLRALDKGGGMIFSQDEISECVELAARRADYLSKEISRLLKNVE
jgi:exosome complex component RRP43